MMESSSAISAPPSLTPASSSPPPTARRLVCARCDAAQLRGVLNQTSAAVPRAANEVHMRNEGDSESESDEDDKTAAPSSQPARPRPRRSNPPPPAAATAASAFDPDLPGADREPSAAMGDLLLKGWTMLGEACPACGGSTPLMRKRGGSGSNNAGETYCVRCRAWVRYQEEGEVEEEEEESEEEEEAAAVAAAPAATERVPAPAAAAAAASAAPPPPRRPPASASASAAASISELEDSALVDARLALVEALRDATLALRRGGSGSGSGGRHGREEGGGTGNENSSDSSSCRASAARLVGECARALAAVRAALGA